jgi:hypothetical protein
MERFRIGSILCRRARKVEELALKERPPIAARKHTVRTIEGFERGFDIVAGNFVHDCAVRVEDS